MGLSGQGNSPLGAIQQWMLEALMQPHSSAHAPADSLLVPGPALGAAACLAVYQRSYRLRLVKCLGDQFPATRHALGDALFSDFATEYLGDCPSRSHTLYDLGKDFPGWLEAHRPDRDVPPEQRESWIDFMVDLAQYEWALFHLFDAPGQEGVPLAELECSDERLALQPCFGLLSLRYPVATYYHAVRAEQQPEFPPAQASCYAIVRREYRMATYPLAAPHFRFLQAMQAGYGVDESLRRGAGAEAGLAHLRWEWHAQLKPVWVGRGFFVATPA